MRIHGHDRRSAGLAGEPNSELSCARFGAIGEHVLIRLVDRIRQPTEKLDTRTYFIAHPSVRQPIGAERNSVERENVATVEMASDIGQGSAVGETPRRAIQCDRSAML